MDSSDTAGAQGSGARFVTTHWSVMLVAGRADSTRAQNALARLCQTYWYPLYAFFPDGVCGRTNLREVERGGKLNPREAMQIIPQICEALQFAHDEGIVHRDIKPENILLDKKGRVKIADFGIAKLVGQTTVPDAGLTGAGDVVGTLNYMAPEQREKPLTVDHRADIFSLGVVFYEVLTGELPLGKFSPPSKVAQVDVGLDEVVVRALEKEPARRYQHVSDLGTDVQTSLLRRQPRRHSFLRHRRRSRRQRPRSRKPATPDSACLSARLHIRPLWRAPLLRWEDRDSLLTIVHVRWPGHLGND